MTIMDSIAAEGTPTDDELHRSLRHDLMMICHAMQLPHSSRVDTMKALRTMAYWPSAEADVARFCDTCAICLSNRNPKQQLGNTMEATRRFAVMMIDKIKFDDDVVALTGMPAALLMTCPRIGDAQYALCHSMTAIEAARVIFCSGIPQFSIPMTIVSDSEPAFASQVMQELAKIFGIKTWDYGAVTSPQHHAKIERRVEPYNRAIKAAMSAGVITCRPTLEVVLSSTLITQTQLTVTYKTTPFERRTGSIPRTHRELYSSSTNSDVVLQATTSGDANVLKALTMHVNELCDWHQNMRDMAHRKSLYPKLSTIAKQHGTDFYLMIGDMVSYNGERWLLLDVTGPPNQEITALIQQATHADAVATKLVRYDTLRPLASAREQLMYTAEETVTAGDFIFFLQGTLVIGGRVIEVGTTEILVHIFDPSPQHKCYMPTWQQTGKEDKSQKKQPKGYEPEQVYVHTSDIEVITQLTKAYQLPKQAWNKLKAKGIVLPLEYTTGNATVSKAVRFK